MTPEQAVAATVRTRTRLRGLRLATAAILERLWDQLESFNEEDVAGFAEKATPALFGAGRASSSVTSAYMSLVTGESVAVPTITAVSDFRHPFIGVWRDLSRGVQFEQAVQTGRARVVELANERVITSQRATLAAVGSERTVGWRRVPQGATCSWCILTSTQRYRSAESASFGHGHHGVNYCDCDIVPIVGTVDPGRVINRPMLAAWKQAQKNQDSVPRWFDADSLDVIDGPDAARLADAALAA